jgi:hypothetical protein
MENPMTTHHAAFWLDHNELRAIALDADGTGHRVLAHLHAHDLHTHPKKTDGHRHPLDARFLSAVEESLSKCDVVALFGPATGKDELISHLETSKSPLRARIATIATLDRVTDGELATRARQALVAADRMHGIHVQS